VQATRQQQIVGYFIEEANEHLDTIERSLLNLQETMTATEQLNELFRAAHSIKGGAAMLGLQSIQKVGHELEDCFKILQEPSVAVNQTIESLFLKGFDALKALVEGLQSPYGLQEENVSKVMATAGPVFTQLKSHLEQQLQPPALPVPQVKAHPRLKELLPSALKKMLLLFKQGDSATSRKQLISLCGQMGQLHSCGEWLDLLRMTQTAIAHSQTSYSTLAPLVIRELKLAGDLLLTGRLTAIAPSENLQKLISASKPTDQRSPRNLTIPAEPKGAAKAILAAFRKEELIELTELLMRAV